MKRIPLLLTALGLVSAAAYAAPELKVTSIGQYIEIDNTSGNEDIGEAIHFANKVNLAYGDWSFGLMARKAWSASFDDYKNNDTEGSGVKSAGHRLEVFATKNFGNYTLGTKWRGEANYDALYLTGSYKAGMFSGNGYISYRSYNTDGGTDYWYSEMTPIIVALGPVNVAWYTEYKGYTGTDSAKDVAGNKNAVAYEWNNQVRLTGNLYTTDRFNLGAEYRYEISTTDENEKATSVKDYQHTIGLNAAYKVTENLTVDGYYLYEMNSYKGVNGGEAKADDYYGEFYLGWTYKF